MLPDRYRVQQRPKDFVVHFGFEAADCYRAAELAEALGIHYYQLNYLISAGRFPEPDFSIRCLRGWKPDTVRRHDKALEARVAKIAARRRS
jgi:hypothetical protein